MELLVAEILVQLLVIEHDVDRVRRTAIDDPGDLAREAQTAARTRSLHLALLRVDFEFHRRTPVLRSTGTATSRLRG